MPAVDRGRPLAMPSSRSLAAAVAAALPLAGLVVSGAGGTAAPVNPKHFFWAQGQAASPPDSLTNDIIYHGGNAGDGAIGVEVKPAVYLVYWGAEWQTGFTTADSNGKSYSSAKLQAYLNAFFKSVGGSPWAAVQTQYCAGAPVGATSCAGVAGARYITNPKKQLKGVWTDPTPVPSDIVTLGLAEN